jgi:hypothetical protein
LGYPLAVAVIVVIVLLVLWVARENLPARDSYRIPDATESGEE